MSYFFINFFFTVLGVMASSLINPLKTKLFFGTIRTLRGCKLNFGKLNFIGVSTTKSWEKSQNFKYG